jgi:hypothetical protein
MDGVARDPAKAEHPVCVIERAVINANDAALAAGIAHADHSVPIVAMALHAGPALAKTEDAKASAIVSAIDASVGVTVGLPSNTRPACTPHASAAEAEPHNAAVGSAMALHAVPALAKAEDAKAFTIVSAIDASVNVTVGLPDNAVVARVCSKETTHERPPSIVAAIALRPVGLLPALHHIDTLTLGTLHVHKLLVLLPPPSGIVVFVAA